MTIFEKLTQLEEEAADFGFKWETTDQILAQIRSEVDEIEVDLKKDDRKKIQEEMGDLLHAVFSLCVFCQFDAKTTLVKSVNKFDRRFRLIQQLAKQEGLQTLAGQPFQKLMALWEKAKETK